MILRPLVQLLNRTSLVLQIAIGLVAGIALALLAPQATDEVGFLGTLFISALKAVAHKMLPIFTMLGAAGIAATLRTAESWEGPLTDALRGEIGAEAENIRAIVAEAQKKVSLS